jgi:hypothetical protein
MASVVRKLSMYPPMSLSMPVSSECLALPASRPRLVSQVLRPASLRIATRDRLVPRRVPPFRRFGRSRRRSRDTNPPSCAGLFPWHGSSAERASAWSRGWDLAHQCKTVQWEWPRRARIFQAASTCTVGRATSRGHGGALRPLAIRGHCHSFQDRLTPNDGLARCTSRLPRSAAASSASQMPRRLVDTRSEGARVKPCIAKRAAKCRAFPSARARAISPCSARCWKTPGSRA